MKGIRKVIILGLSFMLIMLVLLLGCGQKEQTFPEGEIFEPLADYTDWQPQDYIDYEKGEGELAIKIVRLEKGRLVLDTHFVGGDPYYTKGETFLDLRYVPRLEDQTPFDLTNHEITVWVSVPDKFDGWKSRPNGVQVFVKDAEWRCQYGTWVNITKGGKYKATLRPTTGQIHWGYTAPGFEPTRIIIIGVKFAIGTGSLAKYDGELYVDKISIKPDLFPSPLPSLPPSAPQPIFAPGDEIEVRVDGFYLNNKKWFAVGGNWGIIEYGQNFGTTAWFPSGNGISKHVNFVKTYFDYFRRAGIKVVRVFLLTDGRTMFDKNGHVAGYTAKDFVIGGYNEVFKEDVRTFLNLANENGIKVEFVLFDYLIAGKAEFVDGVWVRGRDEIITNENLRKEFIDEFLIPFLEEFGNHPALLGFDVINEPEWVVNKKDGGAWESVQDLQTKAESPIPGQKMEEFITDCIDTIREKAPGKLITVGISCPFVSLVKDLNIDYFALHHYPWMDELEGYHKLEDYLRLLPEGKPWCLEEFPTYNTSISKTEYLNRVLKVGGTGAMLWNLKPEIDDSTMPWEERNENLCEIRGWVDKHEKDILM